MDLALLTKTSKAILELRPGAQFRIDQDGNIDWLDQVQTRPTDEELATQILTSPQDVAEAARKASIDADAATTALVTRLRNATPAQIDTYVDTNITTLASARELFKRILLVMSRTL